MRAVLFYNPAAGNARVTRDNEIGQVCAVLAAHGYNIEAVATTSGGSAKDQVMNAVAAGANTIFACGGDGTVHDILQGIVDNTASVVNRPILGIIPMGSANALARHLGLSMSAVKAAQQLTAFSPRLVPVGRIECSDRYRYFTVMAGAGPDGALIYSMLAGNKGRLGRIAYYIRAASLFASQRFPSFDLEIVESETKKIRAMRSVATMTVRIDNLGGLFGGLVGDAAVHHPRLQLIAVKPPAWLSLPVWFTMGWLCLNRLNPLLHIAHVESFTCMPLYASRIHVQADGEWIGTAPIKVTLIPDAVRLLMPALTVKA